VEGDNTHLQWSFSPDMSIAVLLDGNYRVGVVGRSFFTPEYSEGDWTWMLIDDPDIEWGKECTMQEAMMAACEAYIGLLDSFGDWLPENTLAFRPIVEE
jgi:hypothetical protein